jgi:hypothetical protein
VIPVKADGALVILWLKIKAIFDFLKKEKKQTIKSARITGNKV